MESFFSVIGDGLSGGLFGIIGGLGTSVLKYFTQKSEQAFKIESDKNRRKHDLAMITAETTATIQEIQANVQRDQILMDGKADVEESRGRNAAILKLSENYVKLDLMDKMMFNKNPYTAWLTVPIAILITFIHGIVDVSRTLVRVIITYGSVAFSMYVTYVAFAMYKELGVIMSAEELHTIIIIMLKLLTFTTTTVVGFWFMDKSMSRKFQNMK